MARNPIQDIVPNGRSIRDIPLPEHRMPKKVRPAHKPTHKEEKEEVIEYETEHYNGSDNDALRSARQEFESRSERFRNGRKWKWTGIVAGVLAVIILAIFVSNIFHSSVVAVTPRTAVATIQENLTARKAPAAGDLAFTAITIKEIGSQKVTATGEERVDKAATGIIVVYNNYSSASQRLVKNTRFETPEGLIYRISDSITVPGKKGNMPGSVEATVTADATGDKYNVGLKDFTIPGFKGDPRYDTFYARSKTPLAGGFTGTIKVVADADRKKAQEEIETKATMDLLKQVNAQVAPSSIFFDKAYTVTCTPLQQETVSEKEALIRMDCALSAVVFDRQSLSSHLAKKYVSNYEGEEILVNNLESVTLTPQANFDPTAQGISFGLSGNAVFEWVYDEASLKSDLVGKPKSEAVSIMQQYPMIQKADISIRPVWRRVFPQSVKDITIKKVI